jgi:tagatose-1,6-bisphosphate aldolase
VNFIPNWSVAKIKRIAGDGVKMLLPYHPEDVTLPEKNTHVQRIINDCATHDIPFFLEPIPFSLHPDQPLSNAELLQITVEMVRTYSAMGVDVLKLQFPVDARLSSDESEWLSACQTVTENCHVPWALLSAGVSYDTFATQARIACAAGACGVIVGRAIWKEAVALQSSERTQFLQTTGKQRMRELITICREHASSWFDRVSRPDAAYDWYENY